MLEFGSSFVAIGECMIELRRDPGSGEEPLLRQGFGGDTANTAVYLARCGASCGCDVQVEYLTALGPDQHSAGIRSWLRAEGVGTALTGVVADRRPGLYMVELDEHGERSFAYWRGESAARQLLLQPELIEAAQPLVSCDVAYLSGITLAVLAEPARARLAELLDALRARGGRVVFDPNYRPALWPDAETAREVITAMLRRTDLAMPTFDDEALLFGDADPTGTAARLRAAGVAESAVKLGSRGALVTTDEGAETVVAQRVARVVDSTAAGDAFNAAYLHHRVHGLSPSAAASAGHRLAAAVLAHPGAVIPSSAMPAESSEQYQRITMEQN